jgi:hypothetical protein
MVECRAQGLHFYVTGKGWNTVEFPTTYINSLTSNLDYPTVTQKDHVSSITFKDDLEIFLNYPHASLVGYTSVDFPCMNETLSHTLPNPYINDAHYTQLIALVLPFIAFLYIIKT